MVRQPLLGEVGRLFYQLLEVEFTANPRATGADS
jgi:hypothetical protein